MSDEDASGENGDATNKALALSLKMPFADIYGPVFKAVGKFAGEETKVQLDKLRARRGDENFKENVRQVNVAYHGVADLPESLQRRSSLFQNHWP